MWPKSADLSLLWNFDLAVAPLRLEIGHHKFHKRPPSNDPALLPRSLVLLGLISLFCTLFFLTWLHISLRALGAFLRDSRLLPYSHSFI